MPATSGPANSSVRFFEAHNVDASSSNRCAPHLRIADARVPGLCEAGGQRRSDGRAKSSWEPYPQAPTSSSTKVAAAQIYELLMNYDPKVLKERLKEGDTSDYAKLVNVVARLSDGGLKHERYRDEVVERKERIMRELEQGKREGMTKERFARIERNLNLL